MTDNTTSARLSEKMAQSVMRRYGFDQVQWHYEHGLMLQSIYAVGKTAKGGDFLSWVQGMYDTKIADDGAISTYKKDEYNLDQINPGKLLFDLFRDTGKIKYRNAIETLRAQLKNHPRTESGGFWHKKIYPHQMWLDGLYMQGPFYARYASEFGTVEELLDVCAQLILIETKTREAKTGLLYHAWDESRKQLWSNRLTGCSPHFWGRAMGWYCMALVDVLDYVPATEPFTECREKLIATARRLVSAIEKFQDAESGLWYQILDQGARAKNYLESSASSMFVYFLFKMVRKNYIAPSDAASALKTARSGYRGLTERMIRADPSGDLHLKGICSVAGLGGTPYRDGSFDYYVKEPVVEDDFKGVGPFILASLEAEAAGGIV